MKVLHLSTGDNRGAFTGAYRVHCSLKDAGVESTMFVAEKNTSDTTVLQVNRVVYILYKIYLVFWRLVGTTFYRGKNSKNFYFLNDLISLPVFDLKKKFGSGYFDYIFVYYTSGFLTLSKIEEVANYYGAKLIVYPMDMEPMTGGCHYSWGCDGYKSGCASCEFVKSSVARSLIRSSAAKKMAVASRTGATVLAASELLYKQLNESANYRDSTIVRCLIPVDQDAYNPANRSQFRKKLKVLNSDIVIYFGAQSLDDPRKGVAILLEALADLIPKLELSLKSRLVLLSVGSTKPVYRFGGVRSIHYDYIHDKALFEGLYAAADLFISPSVEDSGPMMVNESILSGVPVIAFKTGVANNLVVDSVTGFLADTVTSTSLKISIQRFLELNDRQRKELRVNARNFGIEKTSKYSQAKVIMRVLKSDSD